MFKKILSILNEYKIYAIISLLLVALYFVLVPLSVSPLGNDFGLVSYWSFDDTLDALGSVPNGMSEYPEPNLDVVYSVNSVSGKSVQILDNNEVGLYVSPDLPNLNADYVFCQWYSLVDFVQDGIFMQLSDDYRVYLKQSTFFVYLGDYFGTYADVTFDIPQDNEFHNFCFSYSDTTNIHSYYIDGQLEETLNIDLGFLWAEDFCIGGACTRESNGGVEIILDEMYFYDTLLDSSQIMSHYNEFTPATCSDGIQNQDETDVDCGGVCDACVIPATCSDGIQNGDETDVDCGGSTCSSCSAPETCFDDIQNADETGVDCGGVSCASCYTPPVYAPEEPVNPTYDGYVEPRKPFFQELVSEIIGFFDWFFSLFGVSL